MYKELSPSTKELLDGLVEHVVYHDLKMRILWANKAACKSAGLPRSKVIGEFCYEIWAKCGERCEDCPVYKAIQSGNFHEVIKTTSDGCTWLIRGYPLEDKQGAIIGGVELTLEITEQRQTFQALKESEEKFRNISENSVDTIFSYDKTGRFTYISPSARLIAGFEPEEIVGQRFSKFVTKSQLPQILLAFKDILKGKNVEGLRVTIKGKDKIKKTVELNASPSIKDGKIVGAHGIVRNITKQKLFEDKLKDSLKEKEVLLQEIHHRVKNNFQIISSLLRLQSSHIKDEFLKNVFKASQDRIQSMALIHQMLYQTQNFNSVDFSSYIRKMVSRLSTIYNVKNKNIHFDIKTEEIFLSIDKAIPCGLIINELVSNSLKHAFFDKEKGTISIELSRLKNGKYRMIVKDSGRGLPSEIDLKTKDSLGLQLVRDLIDQCHGTIKLKRDHGTEFHITFPDL